MKSFLLLLLLVCVTGCGHDEARTGVRNVAEMGKWVKENASDPDVQVVGELIEKQALISADTLDLKFFGLVRSPSEPTVEAEDFTTNYSASVRSADKQIEKTGLESETLERSGALLAGVIQGGFALLGLGGLAAAARYRKVGQTAQTLFSAAMKFGRDMSMANTDEEAENVKTKHMKFQKALGIHAKITEELEAIKKVS